MTDRKLAKQYKAIVWTKDPSQPGQRVTIEAGSLEEARKMLDEQFGEGIVVTLWNEQDAGQPR